LVKYLIDQKISNFYGLSLPLATHADACLFVGGWGWGSQIKKIDGKNDPEKALRIVYAI
jgi:hypothetical protein